MNSWITLITLKLLHIIGKTTSPHCNNADSVSTYPLFDLGMLLAINICFWLVIAIAIKNITIRALMCILIILSLIHI